MKNAILRAAVSLPWTKRLAEGKSGGSSKLAPGASLTPRGIHLTPAHGLGSGHAL